MNIEIDRICDELHSLQKEIMARAQAAQLKYWTGQLTPPQAEAEKVAIAELNARLPPLLARLSELGPDTGEAP